ncbi:hypothetical protein F5B21DRAFT_335300 [Xylaria acuta]|nr:hypothetical protein F5B21DRAFT_335300 [Xylaria acuta]
MHNDFQNARLLLLVLSLISGRPEMYTFEVLMQVPSGLMFRGYCLRNPSILDQSQTQLANLWCSIFLQPAVALPTPNRIELANNCP